MPDRLTNLRINRVAFVPGGDNPEAFVTLWKSRRDPVEPRKEKTMVMTTVSKANDAAGKLVAIAKEERARQAQLGNDVSIEQATAIVLKESPEAKAAHRTLRAEGLDGSNALQKALGR